MEQEQITTSLWKDRENARQYLAQTGLANNLPLFVRFYEGDQWAAPTQATKNIPRISANIIKMICRNKKAAILSSPVRIIYRAEDDQSAEEFTRFSDYIQKEIGQDDIDKSAVSSGVKKGTYVYHYYWDAEARGKNGHLPGGLRCELIDPLNIYFSNPNERDEQKQKWIMIESREEIDTVKAKADEGVDKNTITEDDVESRYNTKEQEGTPMCTVLTRYFRKNGEVYCEKATKSVVVNKAFAITPDIESAKTQIEENATYSGNGEDPANTSLPDKKDVGAETITEKTKAWLYPVVVGNYEPRDDSIYGLGEVEGLVSNQKAINLILSMAVYNIEQTAWSKKVVHPDALRNQRINNDPGQVLTDYSKTGNGIRNLEGQQIPSSIIPLVDTITSITRTVTGSSEVMTGETIGANMSGAAIAQLQSQALLPVEDLRDTFWNVKKKQGLVLGQFYKLYYAKEDYLYEDDVYDTLQDGSVRTDLLGSPVKKKIQRRGTFDSSLYREMDFDVVVEATAGTKSSVAGDISALETLFNHGDISAKTFIELYPEGALSNKTELVKKLGEQEANALQSMQQQMAQDQQTIQQQQQTIQQQNDTINKVYALLNENKRLNEMLAQLYTEANEKLNYANRQIQLGNQKIVETTQDATALAQDLARSQGLM